MHAISVFCWILGVLSGATVVGTLAAWVAPFDAVRDGFDHIKFLLVVQFGTGIAVVQCFAGYYLWRAA